MARTPGMPDSPVRPPQHNQSHQSHQSVRSGLAHLYDSAFLQTHPLSALLDSPPQVDGVTRAQKMRRLLLDCVETLRPRDTHAQATEAARAYAILTYRYIDGLSMQDIAAKLSLSRRQVYREHEKGIEAISSLLADKYPLFTASPSVIATPMTGTGVGVSTTASTISISPAESEVDRLSSTASAEAIPADQMLNSVINLLEPLCVEANRRIHVRVDGVLPHIKADRVHVRQALINVLTYALDVARTDINVTASSQGSHVHMTIDVTEVNDVPNDVACDEASNESLSSDKELSIAHALVTAQGGRLTVRARRFSCGAASARRRRSHPAGHRRQC